MPEFNLVITTSSFIAGVLTFFAPCTLPLVPAFLGIISGVKGSDPFLSEGDLTPYRWRIFKNAVFYVLGFSLVFISFGVAFSYLGTLFIIRELLEKIGGLFIIAFGLVLLGLLDIPWLNSGKQIAVPRLFRHVSLAHSFLLGAVFALGWSPCVGPLLGSVLLLASTSGTVLEGTFLLVVFSIGLGLPFLVTSLLVGKAFTAFGSGSSLARWGSTLSIINKVAGAFLVVIGFLLISGNFSLVHSQFKNYFYNFQYFEVFINKFL
jgi:cytochrome c-type biogenesis protein